MSSDIITYLKKTQKKFQKVGIAHVSLVGSYARWEATPASDLDLFIELSPEHHVTFLVLDQLEALIRSEFPVPKVEFMTKNSLRERVYNSIKKDLITIF